MIVLEGVSLTLGSFQLRRISLRVGRGEYFIVLGPTGAGKTLLLETIAGFHNPREGRVLIEGVDVTYAPPEERGIGFVYQDYVLFPHLTVEENISFGLRAQGIAEPRPTPGVAHRGCAQGGWPTECARSTGNG